MGHRGLRLDRPILALLWDEDRPNRGFLADAELWKRLRQWNYPDLSLWRDGLDQCPAFAKPDSRLLFLFFFNSLRVHVSERVSHSGDDSMPVQDTLALRDSPAH